MSDSLAHVGASASVDPDEVFALPLRDRWLVFAPATRTAAVVNRTALGELAECLGPERRAPSLSALDLWQTLTVESWSRTSRFAADIEKLVIMPTRACNIRCAHCDFGSGAAPLTVLDPRVAFRLVEYAAARLRARREHTMRIHFFGGEPLVAWRVVESVVGYVRTTCARDGLAPHFEVTTNGVFGPEVARFVADEIDSVVVSLEGDEPLHDEIRRHPDGRGTYADVAATLRRLARSPAEVCIRTCVTDRSVGAMAELTARFCRDFRLDVIAFEMLSETDSSREAGLAAPDPYAFAAGLLAAESVAAEHGVRVVHGPSELVGPRRTSCPVGTGSLMLWPDGSITACYLDPGRWERRGLDYALGHVDRDAGPVVDERKSRRISAAIGSKPRCERCFCRSTCAGGCHVDQTPPGCSLAYDDRCRAIRLITAARLLRSLGCDDDAAALLGKRSTAEGLALHSDDRLRVWRKTPGAV